MHDLILSPHFRLSEFTRSATASARHINNCPDAAQTDNLRALCQHVLEPLRQHVGQPVVIASGYRCPALNAAVGGAPGSQHLRGEAADIRIPDLATGRAWMRWMARLPIDQLILERATPSSPTCWIHVSFSRTHNRHQVIGQLVKQKKPRAIPKK